MDPEFGDENGELELQPFTFAIGHDVPTTVCIYALRWFNSLSIEPSCDFTVPPRAIMPPPPTFAARRKARKVGQDEDDSSSQPPDMSNADAGK